MGVKQLGQPHDIASTDRLEQARTSGVPSRWPSCSASTRSTVRTSSAPRPEAVFAGDRELRIPKIEGAAGKIPEPRHTRANAPGRAITSLARGHDQLARPLLIKRHSL